jgi:hypothetical protein
MVKDGRMERWKGGRMEDGRMEIGSVYPAISKLVTICFLLRNKPFGNDG